jgi:hypothetical protein
MTSWPASYRGKAQATSGVQNAPSRSLLPFAAATPAWRHRSSPPAVQGPSGNGGGGLLPGPRLRCSRGSARSPGASSPCHRSASSALIRSSAGPRTRATHRPPQRTGGSSRNCGAGVAASERMSPTRLSCCRPGRWRSSDTWAGAQRAGLPLQRIRQGDSQDQGCGCDGQFTRLPARWPKPGHAANRCAELRPPPAAGRVRQEGPSCSSSSASPCPPGSAY